MIDPTIYHIGEDSQLFVDDLMIEAAQGVTRRWHKPVRHGDAPVLKRDQSWEKHLYFTYSNYVVIRDPQDGLIKCWYEDMVEVTGLEHPWKTAILYAESRDGITFTKPATGIKDKDGQDTNIVMGYQEGVKNSDRNPWAEAGVHSCGIAIDPHPPTPAERFRVIYSEGSHVNGRLKHQTAIGHSPDGKHWHRYPMRASIGSTGGNLNDVSCIHYDESARTFVQNTRDHRMYDVPKPMRTPHVSHWFGSLHPNRPDLRSTRKVVQTRSSDFIHWTEPFLVSTPDSADAEHTAIDNLDNAHYGMQQFSVGRMQFGTMGIFRYVANEMDVRLTFSRDGHNFVATDRGTPFLAPRGPGHWDAYMVSMTSQPIEMGDELWFYHGGSQVHHDWWCGPPEGIDHDDTREAEKRMRDGYAMGLAKLRKDGFASLDGSHERPGYVLTRPFKSAGDRLLINARCRPGGSIQVAVLDHDRNPLPGREAEKSDPFTGDKTAHEVTWGGQSEMGLPAKWRQLLFMIRDSEIFSFRCVGQSAEAEKKLIHESANPTAASATKTDQKRT